jgi:hypothetical protein
VEGRCDFGFGFTDGRTPFPTLPRKYREREEIRSAFICGFNVFIGTNLRPER